MIENIDIIKTDQNNLCYHAGTSISSNGTLATGGRVLNLISLSNSFSDAKVEIIKNLERLNWSGGFYRKDIGYKVIDL